MSHEISAERIADIEAHEYATHHEKLFLKTAVLLAAVTAVEIAWSYLHWPDSTLGTVLEIGGLLAMMSFKFFMVASIFMHLKWDSKLLTTVFYFGLVLAVVVYLVVLCTFEFFSSSSPPYA